MDAAIRLLLSTLLLASPALPEAPGDESVLRNWPAPPYWTPPATAEPANREAAEPERIGRLLRHVSPGRVYALHAR